MPETMMTVLSSYLADLMTQRTDISADMYVNDPVYKIKSKNNN